MGGAIDPSTLCAPATAALLVCVWGDVGEETWILPLLWTHVLDDLSVHAGVFEGAGEGTAAPAEGVPAANEGDDGVLEGNGEAGAHPSASRNLLNIT